MSAQEAVNRASTVSEEGRATTMHASSDWCTPEAYYLSHGIRTVGYEVQPFADAVLASSSESSDSVETIQPQAIATIERPRLPLKGPTAVVAQSPMLVASRMPDMQADSESEAESELAIDEEPFQDASDLDLGVLLGLAEAKVAPEPPEPVTEVAPVAPEPVIELVPSEEPVLATDDPQTLPAPAKTAPDPIMEPTVSKPAEVVRAPLSTEPAPRPYNVPSLGAEFPSYHSQPQIDAKALIQQRALEEADQRRQRIEARKWLGYAPGRPPATPIPFMSGTSDRPAIIAIPHPVRVNN